MVSFNSCATDVRQGTFVSYKMRYIANAMNMRRIEAKLRTLRANRDALERKKTEMTRVLDEELNYVNRQIQNFERIYTQTQKLMKSIDEQMVLADELMNEERRNRRPRNRFRVQNEPKKRRISTLSFSIGFCTMQPVLFPAAEIPFSFPFIKDIVVVTATTILPIVAT